jgi:PAS domain S-box-containing protein
MTNGTRLRAGKRNKDKSISPRPCELAQDITETKATEEELPVAQFSIEHVAGDVLGMNPQGRIVYANKAACQSLGYSREELLSRSVSDIDPLVSRKAWENIWNDLKIRGSLRVETQHRTKQGRVFPVEVTATYLVFQGKEYSLACAYDITVRKRVQMDLQRSLDQVRALARRLQSVREEESKRLAREIHDQLGQTLTALRLDVSSLIGEMSEGTRPPSKKATSVLNLVDETIRAVRRISSELRPGMLDHLGLVATVEWAGEDFESRTGIKCQLDLPREEITIDPAVATAVFRIFQETLTNVARHANASELQVRLAKVNSDLILEVHDNGKGIAEASLSSGESLGILGMRERALLFGGELKISSASGEGTTVRVRIPACAGPVGAMS